MLNGPSNPVLRFIRKLAAAPTAGETDGRLLERFIAQNDETAFATLVQRHGALVLGVCRRVLNQAEDAEDVFQATFLVLARKAESIRKLDSVDSWLYGVAYRLARKARVAAARRQVHERHVSEGLVSDPMHEIVWRDLRPVLDEEIFGLPEKYRLPFIMCYLEGQTNEEVAQRLRCPLGTVWSRLARARQLLQTRLTRRGLTLCGGILATLLAENTGSAAMPAALAEATVKTAPLFAAGKATVGVASAQVITLAEGAMQTMFLTKWIVTVVFLAGGIFGAGAGVCTYRAFATGPAEAKEDQPIQVPAGEAVEPKKPAKEAGEPKDVEKQSVPSQRDGILLMLGTEIKEGENVPSERIITIKVGDEVKKYRRLRKGDKVEPGQLLGRLDDRLARDEVSIKRAKVKASEADLIASEKTSEEAEQRYITVVKIRSKVSVVGSPDEEVRGAKLTWERYKQEVVSKKAAVDVAKLEMKQAQTLLEMYEIRSSIRGVIKAIHKGPGEAVKSLEPVLEIQGTESRD